MVFATLSSDEAKVTARLARDNVPLTSEQPSQLGPGEIPRQPHRLMTSSRTKCTRTTWGMEASSK